MLSDDAKKSLAERFESNVDVNGPVVAQHLGACHVWLGDRGLKPWFFLRQHEQDGQSRRVYANRIAFFLKYNYWPSLLTSLCLNPDCIRAEHVVEQRGRAKTLPCRVCGYLNRNKHGECRICMRERHRFLDATSVSRREKHAALERRKKHGIGLTEQERLFTSQHGKCAVCGDPIQRSTSSTHLDHDHETGRVRAFLCQKCNIAVGMVRENVRIVSRLAAYLSFQQRVACLPVSQADKERLFALFNKIADKQAAAWASLLFIPYVPDSETADVAADLKAIG